MTRLLAIKTNKQTNKQTTKESVYSYLSSPSKMRGILEHLCHT